MDPYLLFQTWKDRLEVSLQFGLADYCLHPEDFDRYLELLPEGFALLVDLALEGIDC